MRIINLNVKAAPKVPTYCLLVGILALNMSCRSSIPLRQTSDPTAALKGNIEPMTEEKFFKALYIAAEKSQREFSPENIDAFFSAEAKQALINKDQEAFTRGISTRVPIDWAWKRSDISPVWFVQNSVGWMPSGGMVLLEKDIFPEGFYREKSKSVSLQNLMLNSPWFEWDADHEVYIPRQGGASPRILQKFYRMLGPAKTFSLYRGGDSPQLGLPEATRNPYQSGKPEANSLIIFSTPSINTALSWSHPSVHQSDINRNELLRATQGSQPTVYVGFEFEYPEIAFLHTSQAVELFIKDNNSKLMCIEKSKFNDPNINENLKKEVELAIENGAEFCNEKWLRGFTSGFPSNMNPALTKTAIVKTSARWKSYPVRDDDFEEGMLSCSVKAGMKINYSMAFNAPANQVRIHANTVLEEWKCPRTVKTNIFYIDADKISATIEP